MCLRYLTVSAACAALLGLAAAGLVRTHLLEVVSALAPKTLEESPGNQPIQAEDGSPSAVKITPAGQTPEETRPTSLPPPASVRHASSRKPVRDTTFEQALDQGIRKLAEHRYEIKRSTLDLALGNLGLLARSVRVVPEVRDGKPLGFRLFAMTADGPIAKLGLRNNDVLVSLNGFDLTTAERVLDAYSKFKTASHLVLGLRQEEHELSQEYTIR